MKQRTERIYLNDMSEEALSEDMPAITGLLTSLNLDMEDLHHSQFSVIRNNGEIVAAGRVRMHSDGTAELCSLGVWPDFRNKGYGGELTSRMFERAATDKLWLVTEIPSFFGRLGYVPVTGSIPEVLRDKQKRCREELDCSAPVVMVKVG